MKLPRGTPVFLRGCIEGSPAWKSGIRIGDRGWVCGPFGCMGCCEDPTDCSTVEFINDAGFIFMLCVQDVHMEKVIQQ